MYQVKKEASMKLIEKKQSKVDEMTKVSLNPPTNQRSKQIPTENFTPLARAPLDTLDTPGTAHIYAEKDFRLLI